jgi:hypothetical protein
MSYYEKIYKYNIMKVIFENLSEDSISLEVNENDKISICFGDLQKYFNLPITRLLFNGRRQDINSTFGECKIKNNDKICVILDWTNEKYNKYDNNKSQYNHKNKSQYDDYEIIENSNTLFPTVKQEITDDDRGAIAELSAMLHIEENIAENLYLLFDRDINKVMMNMMT